MNHHKDNDSDLDIDYDDGHELQEGEHFKEVEIREQDRFLPIANIARIMKKVLPQNAKIAKEAKESIQECVSEFISFITSEASDKCQQEKRKTINGDDILWAMGTLGFDKYTDPLKTYLAKYRDSVRGDKPEKKQNLSGKKDLSASKMSTHGSSGESMMTYSGDNGVVMPIPGELPLPSVAPGKALDPSYQIPSVLMASGMQLSMSPGLQLGMMGGVGSLQIPSSSSFLPSPNILLSPSPGTMTMGSPAGMSLPSIPGSGGPLPSIASQRSHAAALVSLPPMVIKEELEEERSCGGGGNDGNNSSHNGINGDNNGTSESSASLPFTPMDSL